MPADPHARRRQRSVLDVGATRALCQSSESVAACGGCDRRLNAVAATAEGPDAAAFATARQRPRVPRTPREAHSTDHGQEAAQAGADLVSPTTQKELETLKGSMKANTARHLAEEQCAEERTRRRPRTPSPRRPKSTVFTRLAGEEAERPRRTLSPRI